MRKRERWTMRSRGWTLRGRDRARSRDGAGSRDRAQSEALGFALVFALIVASVGIVSVAGFGTLNDARNVQQVNNAEGAFEVLADNLADVTKGGASSRSTEVKLGGGQVAFGDPVYVNVSGVATGSDANFSFNRSVAPVVYRGSDGARVVYAAGAVIRDDGGGAVVVREPAFLLDGDRSVIQLVHTRSRGSRSVGGDATVLVRTERADAELLRANATEYDVTIAVTSPRAEAWKRTLDARDGVDCSGPTDGTVTCTLTTDRVYVTVVRVDVSFE